MSALDKLEQARQLGRDAYEEGDSVTDNPYPKGSQWANAWEEAYEMAASAFFVPEEKYVS